MTNKQALGLQEFVALMALMMALVALSIDTMLPALQQIAQQLNVDNANDAQLIIGVLFIGLGFGQLLFGPLSDSIGRKPAIYYGLSLYLLGCIISLLAESFEVMLLGRLLQGIGLAGPRVVSMALIRDMYQGREMARVMSLVMSIFIIVPAIAPGLGQLILWLAPWQVIFVVFMLLGLLIWLWLALRQPETLNPANRRLFHWRVIGRGFLEVVSNRVAISYTLAAGTLSGAFVAFLTTSQQILQLQFGSGEWFPLLFACLAGSLGAASLLNGRIVMRYGMRFICQRALLAIFVVSTFSALASVIFGPPSLALYMAFLCVILFFVGLVFGNMSSVAMEPLGHLAGVGAAVVSAVSTLLSVALGLFIGSFYQGDVSPIVLGFCICSIASLALTRMAGSE